MNYEQKELIHSYLSIQKEIKRKEEYIKRATTEYTHQNYFSSVEFSIEGLRTRGFRMDVQVSGHVDYIRAVERNIAKLQRKLKHFNRYMATVPPNVIESLKRRYLVNHIYIDDIQTLGSDKKILDEINEIEEAIRFEFGEIKVYKRMQSEKEIIIVADKNEEPSEADFRAIVLEETVLGEETTEEAFETMSELLGV